MKYAFVREHAEEIPIVRQCQLLGISKSGYYAWLKRPTDTNKRREKQAMIDEAVRLAFFQQKQRYGSPRLTVDLCESGFAINENTVAIACSVNHS